jgi:hypothetical protein
MAASSAEARNTLVFFRLLAQVAPQGQTPEQATQSLECEVNCARPQPVRLSWAKLLKRMFEIDMEHCRNCGSELKIIAAILEQPVIEKILTHLGLQALALPRSPCGCERPLRACEFDAADVAQGR